METDGCVSATDASSCTASAPAKTLHVVFVCVCVFDWACSFYSDMLAFSSEGRMCALFFFYQLYVYTRMSCHKCLHVLQEKGNACAASQWGVGKQEYGLWTLLLLTSQICLHFTASVDCR